MTTISKLINQYENTENMLEYYASKNNAKEAERLAHQRRKIARELVAELKTFHQLEDDRQQEEQVTE